MPTERDRQFDELMKRSLDAIGIRLEIHKDRFAELIKLENQCRLMMRSAAWIADYPDGDNFMQLALRPEHRGRATTPATGRRSSTGATRNRACCPTVRSATSSTTK